MKGFEFDDCGNYHDPRLRLERTDIAQQAYAGIMHDHMHWKNGKLVEDTPYVEQRTSTAQSIAERIMQQIVGESPYKPDMEFEVYHRTQELEAQNALPDGVTGEEIFNTYLRIFCGE